MENYKTSILIAIIIFPFIAFILTIPYLIYQYHKYGATSLFKNILFYSFIFYLISAYFIVILPLPSQELVKNLKGNYIQLIPFNFINDIKLTVNYKISNLNSLLNFLNKPTVYTVLFNLLLTMPFGFYLRYYFNKNWFSTILYTFFLSLFFEFTQLSGLYFIYPRPYRIFDVDDLIINSSGGILGYILAPLLTKFLPTREELIKESYNKGTKVSILRRLFAFIIDLFIMILISILLTIIFYDSNITQFAFLFAVIGYELILPLLTKGKTLGQKVVNISLDGINKPLKKYKIILRNFLLTFFICFPYMWIEVIENILYFSNKTKILVGIKISITIFQIINILYYLSTIIKKGEHLFLYEKITNTKNISTIKLDTTQSNE